jgi:hypothetical protein
MKFETRKKNQLKRVKHWLGLAKEKADPYYTNSSAIEVALIVAMQQLVNYLEMEDKK